MTVSAQRRSAASWTYLPDLASAPTPRYTSYPPATRFNSSIGPQEANEALEKLPGDAALSIYLHIPFCQKLCWYCGCHTSVPTVSDPVSSYVEALQREIELVGARTPASATVTRIHFGGGSPDILSAGQVEGIFSSLHSAFSIGRFAEIAAELDPRGVSPDTIAAFARAGLSRASLGVQVLDPSVQRKINRIQTKDQIAAAIRLLRSHGIEALNIDMMYGLPGQRREHVVETALFAASQDADRIAVFGYAHVPWMKKHQKAILQEDLPAGEERFRQAEAAAETLERCGYVPVGFDHFAAPGDSLVASERQGRLRRNFQGYTDDNADALIGLGASAISTLPGLIYQNTPDTQAYRNALSGGASPVVRGIGLTSEDKRIADVIERILCDFQAYLDPDLHVAACPSLHAFRKSGLIEMQGNRLTVTEAGRPYVRNIAACFDPLLATAPGRHSLTV